MKKAVTKNKNIRHTSLQQNETMFAQIYSKNNTVRWGVADNPNTPCSVLTRLAEDGDWSVRCGVADNPNYARTTIQK